MPHPTLQRDCTPVELPSPTHRGPLKRSNSAASIHSLPTPPPTRKRKRSHSRHSRATDSDSEDEDRLLESDVEETRVVKKTIEMHGALRLGNKRRKMLQVDKIAAELSSQAKEDAFWGVAAGDKVDIFAKAKATAADTDEETDAKVNASAKKKAKVQADKAEGSRRQRSASPEVSPSSTPPSRLLTRTGTGLLSPPQSKRRSPRKKAVLAIPPPIFEAPISPAPTRASERLRKKQQLERDSPNNPFLDSPASGSVTSEPRTPVRPSRAKRVEKPTITYVLYVNPSRLTSYPLNHALLAVASVSNSRIRCSTAVSQRLALRLPTLTRRPTSPSIMMTTRQTKHVHRKCSSLRRTPEPGVGASSRMRRLLQGRPGAINLRRKRRSQSGTLRTKRTMFQSLHPCPSRALRPGAGRVYLLLSRMSKLLKPAQGRLSREVELNPKARAKVLRPARKPRCSCPRRTGATPQSGRSVRTREQSPRRGHDYSLQSHVSWISLRFDVQQPPSHAFLLPYLALSAPPILDVPPS